MTDYWDGYEPWDSQHAPATVEKEEVGGSAYCNRCKKLAVPLHKMDGIVGGAYWRGTGDWDKWLKPGERVVCIDCIITSKIWEDKYAWYPLAIYLIMGV